MRYLTLLLMSILCSLNVFAQLSFEHVVIHKDKTITLQNTSKNVENIEWSFDDKTTDKEAFQYEFEKAGIYEICLTGDNLISNKRETLCQNIAVGVVQTCEAGFTTAALALNVDFTNTSIGTSLKYAWDFGDGNTSNNMNPSHEYREDGEYRVILTILDLENDCQDEYSDIIVVGTVSCSASFTYESDPEQNLMAFASTSTGSSLIYNWTFGDGNTSEKEKPQNEYKNAGVYQVCLKVTDKETDCVSESCDEILVGNIDTTTYCKAGFTMNVDHSALTVNFKNFSSGNFKNVIWDLGNGDQSEEDSFSYEYKEAGAYKVCLTVYNEQTRCESSICKTLVIGQVPCVANFVFSTDGDTVNFKDKSIGNYDAYFWSFGDDTYSKQAQVEKIYEQGGAYKACLAIRSETGDCADEVCKEVIIDQEQEKLSANFSFVPNNSLLKGFFIDKSTGTPTSYYWTFGDGKTAKGVDTIVHEFDKAGIYKVCLQVINADGTVSEICKEIKIGTLTCNLTADFGAFIDNENLAITGWDKSEGSITDYYWTFGDGSTSGKDKFEHQYKEPGEYLVGLSISDSVSECRDYVSKTITIGTVPCKADFKYSVNPETNVLDVESTSKGINISAWYWSFGDGNYSKGANADNEYKESGIYVVELTIKTEDGCSDIIRKKIQLGNVKCSADFNVFVDTIEQIAVFAPEVIGKNVSYLWNLGDGAESKNIVPKHQYRAPGYYTVKLTIYDEETDCMDSYEEVVLIGEAGRDCEADFYFEINDLTVNFFDQSKGDVLERYWNFGEGGAGSNDENPSHTYIEADYKAVCLTIVNADGIKNTTCKKVPVLDGEEKCLAEFDYFIQPLSGKVLFTDQSVGNIDYWYWEFGDDSISRSQNPLHSYVDSGYYTVSLIVADTTNGTCKSRTVEFLNVNVDTASFKASFSYVLVARDSLKSGGYPVDFVGVASGTPGSYAWEFGDGGTNDNASELRYSYDTDGNFLVCLTVYDENSGDSSEVCEIIEIAEKDISTGVQNHLRNAISLAAYPNPTSSFITIQYDLAISGQTRVELFDINGKQIQTFVNNFRSNGDHLITIDLQKLSTGIYHLRISQNGESTTKKIVKQ